jgi:cbb3-type cytochrome oxidase subunit 3
MTGLLGHQGAWDEVLYFAVPVIAVLLWVRWAEKRARARREAEAEADDHPETGETTDGVD